MSNEIFKSLDHFRYTLRGIVRECRSTGNNIEGAYRIVHGFCRFQSSTTYRNVVLSTATYLDPTFAKQRFDMVPFQVDHEAPSTTILVLLTVLAYYKIIYGYGSTSASHTVTTKQV